MIFKTLVECLLKKYDSPDDRLVLNALHTLTQEIRRDLTQAFMISRPLVDRHASVFGESRSYFDFLMKLSELPSLQDLSDPVLENPAPRHDSPDPKRLGERAAWIREKEAWTQKLASCQQQLQTCVQSQDDWAQEKASLQQQLATCRDALKESESQRTDSVNLWKKECEKAEKQVLSLEKDLSECREHIATLQGQASAWAEKQQQESRQHSAVQENLLQQRQEDIQDLTSKLEQCYQYIHPLHTYMQQLYLENWKLYDFVDKLQTEKHQILSIGNRLWKEYTELRRHANARRETYQEIQAKTELLQEAGVRVIQDSDLQEKISCLSTDRRCEDIEMCDTASPVPPEEEPLFRTFKQQWAQIQAKDATVNVDSLAQYVQTLHQRIETCRSDLLAGIAQDASLPTETVTLDWIKQRVKDWISLKEMTDPVRPDPVAQIKKRIHVYNTLTQSVPHLQSVCAAQQLGLAYTTLRTTLYSQNIQNFNLEDEHWFETFVYSYVDPMFQFIRKFQGMEPSTQTAYMTQAWYEAINEKLDSFQSENLSGIPPKEKRKSDAHSDGKVKKKKCEPSPSYCKHVNHLQMVTLENVFRQLYQEHFQLKLKFFQNVAWTQDEKDWIKGKLNILNELSSEMKRPSHQLNIYVKYIEYDLNTAIGDLKSIKDIPEINEFLSICMETTNAFLQNLLKTS